MNTHFNTTTLITIAVIIGFLGLLTVLTIVARDMLRVIVAALGSRVADTFGIWFRAGCYFLLAFLSAVADKISESLMHDIWPSPQSCVLGVLMGTIAGIVAIRAFNDSSGQKIADDLKAKKNGNGGSGSDFGTSLTTMASLGKITGSQPSVAPPVNKVAEQPSPAPKVEIKPEAKPEVSTHNVVAEVMALAKQTQPISTI